MTSSGAPVLDTRTECRRLWPYCTFCNALLYGDTCTCGGFETPTCETDDEAETVFGVSDSDEEREVASWLFPGACVAASSSSARGASSSSARGASSSSARGTSA